MTLAAKRMLYISFMILFFSVSPLLILYASGYRFHFQKFTFEKTGSLTVETSPKDAGIFLNGENTGKKTPAKISFLLPGQYHLRISKPGYYDWEKTITIESNRATLEKNIFLVRKNTPKYIIQGDIEWMTDIPRSPLLLFLEKRDTEKFLTAFHIQDRTHKILSRFPLSTQIRVADQSQNFQYLLFEVDHFGIKEFLLLDSNNLSIQNIQEKTRQWYEKMRFDKLNPTILYALRSNVIFRIDLSSLSVQPVISEKIDEFTVYGTNIYYTSKQNDTSFLKRKNLLNGKDPDIIVLPKLSHYRVTLANEHTLILSDTASGMISILRTDIFQSRSEADIIQYIIFQDYVKKLDWSRDRQRFVYNNDFEIWTFALPSKTSSLLHRLSTPIKKTQWAVNENFILYQTDTGLFLIELREGEKNTYTLAEFENIINFSVKEESDIITSVKTAVYIVGKYEGKQGLFMMPLTP